MRIAYLTASDPMDRRSWSGTQYYMARALEKHCGEVFHVGPLPLLSAKVGKVISWGLQKVGVTYLYTHADSVSRKLGKMAQKKMEGQACDVIFAPAGSVILANFQTNLRIVYLSDTTHRLMAGYYSEFTGQTKAALRVAEQMEQSAIRGAARQVYPSRWAAESAIRDYGADPATVHVVPFGANIDEWPDRGRALEGGPRDKCRLLFVGREWERKGGEIAFETLVALERLGVGAELIVLGCKPPERFQHPSLRVIPFLNKNRSEERDELEKLYFASHFAMLPTRAECYGIALCEANAYGLPVLVTRTGGVPEIVRRGVNGFMLPVEARGAAYAALIRENYADQARYESLRQSSRHEFETRLNWDAWGRSMRTILWSTAFDARTNSPGPSATVCEAF